VNQDFQGRVIDGMGLNSVDDWSDRVGHGTHVAGIMIGSGILSGGDPVLKKFDRSFAGVAPLASIVVQEVDVDPTTGKSQGLDASTDLGPILDWAYQKGARIHNDSWGDDDAPDGTYTLHSAQVDKYIWEHPDYLPIFAAGNSGTDGEYQKEYVAANQKLLEELSAAGVNPSNTSQLESAIASCYLGDLGGGLGGLFGGGSGGTGGGGIDIGCLLSGDPTDCDLGGTATGTDTGTDAGTGSDTGTSSSSTSDICQTLTDIQNLQQQAADNSKGKIDPGSINSPGTAKNVVTVGASEGNLPPTDPDYKCTDQDTSELDLLGSLLGTSSGSSSEMYCTYQAVGFPETPFASDDMSDNVNGIAAFSSRGPTLDGRIKPDIVAPGTRIISDSSALAQASVYWATYNTHYAYAGGTSQATPLVAGSALLVREWLQKNKGQADPSAALIKALLMNDAHDIYPGQYGEGTDQQEIDTQRPNSVEGWGRLDVGSVVSPTGPETTLFVDQKTGLQTGDAKSYTYHVKAGTPLAVTAAWSDYPADPTSGKNLVNDLDLTVTGPDGVTLLGNGAADRTNNVETVDVTSPMEGDYVIKVAGYNVPMGPQPFALAISGDATAADAGSGVLKGDLNGDGKLSISDVTLALRIAAGIQNPTSDQLQAGDVSPANQPDGKITVTDVTVLLQAALGLTSF
jgi:hypothetical protein